MGAEVPSFTVEGSQAGAATMEISVENSQKAKKQTHQTSQRQHSWARTPKDVAPVQILAQPHSLLLSSQDLGKGNKLTKRPLMMTGYRKAGTCVCTTEYPSAVQVNEAMSFCR